jgi:hypothetical protein
VTRAAARWPTAALSHKAKLLSVQHAQPAASKQRLAWLLVMQDVQLQMQRLSTFLRSLLLQMLHALSQSRLGLCSWSMCRSRKCLLTHNHQCVLAMSTRRSGTPQQQHTVHLSQLPMRLTLLRLQQQQQNLQVLPAVLSRLLMSLRQAGPQLMQAAMQLQLQLLQQQTPTPLLMPCWLKLGSWQHCAGQWGLSLLPWAAAVWLL